MDINSLVVFHLFYADDLLVMIRAGKKKAYTFKKCFDLYCRWSGQNVNMEKLSIFFSKNTPQKIRKDVHEATCFKDMGGTSIYLGNSLNLGKNRSNEFARLKERVQGRLEGWRKHPISKASKAVLINSVVQLIPTYTMATVTVPDGVCKELNRSMKRFWWFAKQGEGKYLALRKRDEVYKPKAHGGLGFRRFAHINRSLLSKLAWKLARGENSLWTQIFRAKYLKRLSFFQYKLKKLTFPMWQGIISAREWILCGSCF